MNWKTTWSLLCVAVLLFGFIWFVELKPTPSRPPAPRLLTIRPEEITRVQLTRTNNEVIWVQKSGLNWNLTLPLFYPARTFAIESLLKALAELNSPTYITPQELSASHRSLAEYGLDVPVATLTLLDAANHRTQILFGSRTPVGDHVYAQLLTMPGIYLLNAELLDRLPRGPNDWRDTSLLNLVGLSLDRMEVRAPGPGRGFLLQETNKTFYLTKPQPVRASRPKVEALLLELQGPRVAQFYTDDPRAELEPLGLQPPEAELAFGNGTNDVLVVQFGKSPGTNQSLVFARRLAQTNIVLVPRTVLDAVLTPSTELRDRHLFSFTPAELDTIEVAGLEKFTLHRETNGTWTAAEPQPALADTDLMHDWLNDLDRLEGTVEKDVVTDFSAYALEPPARQYTLKSAVTNADGIVTNRVLSRLDIGGRQQDKIFVRRVDETSVYSITVADFDRLPAAAWQLRDRRVWAFTTNQISRVTVRDKGSTRTIDRTSTGQWKFAPGSQGILDDRQFALEETMFRLGELRAAVWVAKGDENRARYGFTDDGYKLTIELKNGDKLSTLTLEFGNVAPSQYHYALANVDGQSWIFELPLGLYFQLMRDFSNPPLRAAP